MKRKNVIFGTGKVGKKAFSYMRKETGYEEIIFCDNDSQKWGGDVENVIVVSPDDLRKICEDEIRVVIAVANYMYIDDIASQLLEIGILEDCINVYDSQNNEIRKFEEIYGQIDYSQDGEESYLKQKFGDKKGVFVDVGANHPFLYSNTFWASKCGWKGINIEPDETNYKKLCFFRPNDINLQIGVGSSNGILPYYRFSMCHQGNTFDKNRALEVSKVVSENFVEEQIEVKTLQTVFDEYGITTVDILDIDAEEMDFEVLQGIDWDNVHIECILVEQRANNLKEVLESKMCNFLAMKGYEPVNKYCRTVIYEKEEIK